MSVCYSQYSTNYSFVCTTLPFCFSIHGQLFMQLDRNGVAVTYFASSKAALSKSSNAGFIIYVAVIMIFQALDVLLDLAANERSSNDNRHPDYRADNMDDMRYLVDYDHNDSVSGDIFFFSTVLDLLLFYH